MIAQALNFTFEIPHPRLLGLITLAFIVIAVIVFLLFSERD
jgi:hypothetical protein